MKVAIVLLGLVAIGLSAPQPRKVFHEHFEDFLQLIMDEAEHDLDHIMGHYLEFEEFLATFEYLRTTNFKELVYEMESLPEFKAVTDFLENDNIDILYFLDLFNNMIEEFQTTRKSRHGISGTDLTAFINDSIDLFPKEKLQALFEQKKSEDEDFRVAMENLESDEWQNTFAALWRSEVFQNEVQTLKSNGVDVDVLLKEIKAFFGQN